MNLLTNKYLLAAVGGAGLILLASVWHNIRVASADRAGYERGMTEERLVWEKWRNVELQTKNALLKELQEKYRALEQKNVDDLAKVAADHRKELQNVRIERDKALADARAGTAFRLRWAATCAPTPQYSGGSGAAAPGAGAGGAVGTATCELPEQTREDLIRLAADADKVVLERNALLAVALKDREVCR